VNQPNYTITAFGKIIFVPTDEDILFLPEMNLLLFKDEDRGDNFPWRAACIELELDASGNSIDEAWESLKSSIKMYIEMEKKASGGSATEAAKNIIKAVFTPSNQKTQFMELYRKAQLDYSMKTIESGKITRPITKGQDTIISIINELKAA
jgi:hypothetical protein